MKHCAILTMDDLSAFECYDHLIYPFLEALGWQISEVSWRSKAANWNHYDVVLVRSPWDYQDDADAFIRVLNEIEQSSAMLQNAFELLTWNVSKTYLKDLEQKGVDIVPTIWGDQFQIDQVETFANQLSSEQMVIKPVVSANADNTFRFSQGDESSLFEKLEQIFQARDFMVQPFMHTIQSEGEYSLFYFNGVYSHCIVKKPAKGDFRVQEEHGGQLSAVEPEAILFAAAEKVNACISPVPLYSRLDFVRSATGFQVMELELIEPSLYFNMDPESPERFAQAVEDWYQSVVSATA